MDRNALETCLTTLRAKIETLPSVPLVWGSQYGHQAVTNSEWRVKERHDLEDEVRDLERELAALGAVA